MVLVNFTGYACTNCHWMKANMFTKPEVSAVMKNMVLVDLYTDGTDAASESNQKLEEEKFQTVAIPYYVLYDGNQNVVATFPGLTRKPEEYLAFLNTKGDRGSGSDGQRCTGRHAFQDPRRLFAFDGRLERQSRGAQLLGYLVRTVPLGDSGV